MAGQVHYEVRDHVATVTLDNQKARNAFDYEMCMELKRLWGVISEDPDDGVLPLGFQRNSAFTSPGWLRRGARRAARVRSASGSRPGGTPG